MVNLAHYAQDNFLVNLILIDLNSSTIIFGSLPLKLVSNRNLVAYGKHKVNEIRAASKKTVATILDVNTTALQESGITSSICCRSKQDLDNIMTQIKSEFANISSKSKKITLLTLASES